MRGEGGKGGLLSLLYEDEGSKRQVFLQEQCRIPDRYYSMELMAQSSFLHTYIIIYNRLNLSRECLICTCKYHF